MNFKKSRTIMWVGFVIGIISMLMGTGSSDEITNPWIFGIGMLVFILSILQASIFYRCPHCNYSLMNVKGSVPKYCPKCGEEINDESQGEK